MLLLFSEANGNIDPYYVHFTTPRQTSLILGTSRAAQGIQPQILNKIFNRNDFYNYSFTIFHSPYGPTYLKSIKKKIKKKSKDGIFIITVDPWSISSECTDPNDTSSFRELQLCLAKIKFPNYKPNIEYLLKDFNINYKNLLYNKDTSIHLHANGWLEVNLKMDSVSQNKRIKDKIRIYKNDILPSFKFSKKRLEYLNKTIKTLKKHGLVYLIRLPVHPDMMKIDEQLMPSFTKIMKKVSFDENVEYIDLTNLNDSFSYTDGNHIYKKSGKKLTEIIANTILKIQDNKTLQNHLELTYKDNR